MICTEMGDTFIYLKQYRGKAGAGEVEFLVRRDRTNEAIDEKLARCMREE